MRIAYLLSPGFLLSDSSSRRISRKCLARSRTRARRSKLVLVRSVASSYGSGPSRIKLAGQLGTSGSDDADQNAPAHPLYSAFANRVPLAFLHSVYIPHSAIVRSHYDWGANASGENPRTKRFYNLGMAH